jgi:hypothetical protein
MVLSMIASNYCRGIYNRLQAALNDLLISKKGLPINPTAMWFSAANLETCITSALNNSYRPYIQQGPAISSYVNDHPRLAQHVHSTLRIE